jgi:hypothetical protein
MKTYKTYQARNAVKAALVTNHIKAQKKLGVDHNEAKAEAYRLYNIKAGLPYILKGLNARKSVKVEKPTPDIFKALGLPPLPEPPTIKLPPLPKVGV